MGATLLAQATLYALAFEVGLVLLAAVIALWVISRQIESQAVLAEHEARRERPEASGGEGDSQPPPGTTVAEPLDVHPAGRQSAGAKGPSPHAVRAA